jgi:hypothetical protein
MFSSILLVQGPQPSAWSTSRCATDVPNVGQVATIQGLECIFGNIVTIITAIAGLAVFIMLLSGGLKYLTSGGDQKAMEQAKGTLTYAILGLVAIIAAYLILNFLSLFTGIPSLLKFTVPG